MTEKQISPEQVAAERLAAEEEARRRSRLSELAREEAESRRVLETKVEEQTAILKETLAELTEVDGEHRRARRDAGRPRHSLMDSPLSRSVDQFLQGAFPGFLRAREGAKRQGLAALDPLAATPSEEPTGRPQPQGLPAATLEGNQSRETARFLNTLSQRARMLRQQYARDLAFGELVSPDEKDAVSRLSEEQRGQIRAMLTGSE